MNTEILRTGGSEALFRLLLESTDDVVNLNGVDGERLYVSPSYYRLTGWTPDEIAGTHFSARVHPDDLEAVLAAREANRRGESTRVEYRCRCKDGRFVWMDTQATPILSASDGRVEQIMCVSRDVSQAHLAAERDRAALELATRLSKCDQIREAADAVLDALSTGDGGEATGQVGGCVSRSAVLVYGHDGVCRFVTSRGLSEAYCKAVEGHCPWEAGAMDAATIVVNDAAIDPALAAYRDLLARERIGALAFLPLSTEKGVVGKIMLYAVEAGGLQPEQIRSAAGVAAYAGVAVGRILATRRLERSETRFRTLVEGADVIVWEHDCAVDSLTYVSPQAARLGYPLEEWLTPGFWEAHLDPEDRAQAAAFCEEQVSAGKAHRLQYRMRHADGSVVWIDDFVTVDRAPNGSTTLRGVMVDISDRKRDEAALLEARAAAYAASRAKSEFLANMSHEMRTPLTAILGYADLLRDESESTNAANGQLQSIEIIHDAGQHLLSLINDILDLSKIEADKMTVETIETPIAPVLADVESLVRARAVAKGVTLRTSLATPVPDRMMSDPTRLRQILVNLVGNAVKFTQEGGVSLTARVEGQFGQPRLVIDVEDTGPGMTPGQAELLFAPFSQADTTVTRQHGGTGLGLAISRRLARLMGGDVTLAWTEPSQGSRFRLDLPLVPAADASDLLSLEAARAEFEPVSPSQRGLLSGRILLAEDSPVNQRLVSSLLRKAGALVEVAESGRIALQMLDRAAANGRPFNLLLTDIQMPEMDGYALAQTLRERGSMIAIVALTANAMAEDRKKCIDAGCDDYASKPVDKVALLETCAKWLSKAAPARADLAVR